MASAIPRTLERLQDVAASVERQRIAAYIGEGSLRNLATAPLIYSLLVPLAALDLWVSVYQWTCFPIYGIRCVGRSSYFVLDRHKLAYLNGIEKLNCTFCSYANGVLAYAREVASRTEQYWCPIKHARQVVSAHRRYRNFFGYGDARSYRRDLPRMRRSLRAARHGRRGG
jgi:hypothetical protein